MFSLSYHYSNLDCLLAQEQSTQRLPALAQTQTLHFAAATEQGQQRGFDPGLPRGLVSREMQIDYNISFAMFDLIHNSALPQMLCLHSICVPGKHIERVARKQSISNPYGYTCPTKYSNHNEFKYLKIDCITSSTELLAKHVFPCVEYIDIIDNGAMNYRFIFTITRYNVKCLNLYNSNFDVMHPEICSMYKLRELSLFNVTGIDNAIDRMSCCKSLSKLDMSFNRITEFNKLYDILLNTKLRILNLSFNDIEYLKHVNQNTSTILSKSILEVLDLSNNKLTLITMQWMLTPSLRVLNCSFNQIRNVYFSGFLLYGNASQLSTLNLANNRDLIFEQNIFNCLTGLTEIDLSETNISSDSLPENVPNLCKIYLNRNSLWQYVRFTCKYNPEYEIYLKGNHIQNIKAVRMFYATRVLDISHNLLETLLGSDCNDISQTKILDLSYNQLRNIQRFDINANSQLRKLILTNSYLHEIYINISLSWNVSLIQLHITSICSITTRNCPFSGEQLKRDALEGWFERTNVDSSQINFASLHIIADSWSCEDYNKIFIHVKCIEI
ncbi:hypothetical protein GJ496_008631 [Pomphorhynchus laevis]|nr:hypothetical protein GJ496_008631 [Pomphorhynchus laevis]